MDNFSVRAIVPAARHAHDTPSRCEVAFGVIRGRVCTGGVLLPLVVRGNLFYEASNSPLAQLVQTLGIRHPRCYFLIGGHDGRCIRWFSRCAWDLCLPQTFIFTLHERPQSRTWMGLAGNLAGRGYLFWKVS